MLLASAKYRVTWKTFALPIIGLVAFFAYIYIFNVDIQQIIAKAKDTDLVFYALGAAVSLLDVLFFTLAWRSLLRFLSVKLSLLKSFAIVWLGIYVDTLIPAESVSGELAKIYAVSKDQNGVVGKATASIVAQRLIGMGINIVTLLVGAILLVIESLLFGMLLGLVLFLIAMICLFFSLLLVLSFREKWTLRILNSMISFAEWITRGHWKMEKLRKDVLDIHQAFHNAIREYVRAPKTLMVAVCLSIASWTMSILVFYLVFLAIGYTQISLSAILVTSSIFVAVKAVPIGIPFEVGLPEITLTTLLVFFNVPGVVSATATILMRLLTMWMRFLIGFIAQQWLGIKTATVMKESGLTTGEG